MEFRSKEELIKYLSNYKLVEVGIGTEGKCFKTDNKAIKILNNPLKSNYHKDRIITKKDINLDSFLFPEELYTVNNIVYGYTTEYIEGDIFNKKTPSKIDELALLKAYKKILEDVKALSKNQILIYDISNNLLFNNKELKAIDTLEYSRKDDSYAKILYANETNIKKSISNGLINATGDISFFDQTDINTIVRKIKLHQTNIKY